MRHLARRASVLIFGALISLVGFSGCETFDTPENLALISSMKTFQMGDVHGSLTQFSSRNQQDAVVLTQEMVARQLESLGYREVSSSEQADMTVIPSWSFYEERSPALKNAGAVSYEQSLYQAGTTKMARMGLQVLGGSGQVLWSSSSSWGFPSAVSTTQDFSNAAQQALSGFPEAKSDATGTTVQATPSVDTES